jgi:aspartate ammonia-lyase
MIKMAAVKANYELGLLSKSITDAIVLVCKEILTGRLRTDFVVDLIQGGAGTSTNMNANEVIANRALEILGHKKGEYQYCHPNDHVNLSQSTNDVYPSALKLAFIKCNSNMMAVLHDLIASFRNKGAEFANVIKMGRTQLQDAVPITLGQEFEAYAVALEAEVERFGVASRLLLRLNMGGTAIGTGINSDPEYRGKVIYHLRDISGLEVRLDPNLIAATQDTGPFVTYSSVLKRLAIKLSRICNDLRLLSSGPRTGFNEINLPKMQPGSSIMPGKINPVIPEVVNQVCYKVIGNDLTVTMASEAGQLELNVMEPIIAQSIFGSIDMIKNGMATLKMRCIDGITANEKRSRELVENSIGIITALSPVLGYEICGELAKEALQTEKSIAELVLERKLLSKEEANRLLAPKNMLQPTKITAIRT